MLELKRTRIELGTVLDTAIESSRPHLEANQHQLRVNIDDRGLLLDADLTRLAQVVSNLLNNASKYTPPGGIIEISATRQGDQAVVTVGDNGIGIPQAHLEEVFETLTGWGTREDKQKAVEAGFDVHLTKPVDATMLYRALAEIEQRDIARAANGANP